ncbi:HutD family protein [Acetobacter senegalensis]|nr:HutD family protein [Acetobacter senegalensis]
MTREIAAGDGWRVSLADIDADGDFSAFPGLKRHLGLASEGQLTLLGVHSAPVLLEALGQIIAFDGEVDVSARCHGKVVSAFNLMAEPVVQAELTCRRAAFTLPAGTMFVLLPLVGGWRVESAAYGITAGEIITGRMETRQTVLPNDDSASLCLVASVLPAT